MRHQFFGGPLNGKVILLDVVLADQAVRESIPWEEYERVSSGSSADGVLEVVQWRFRDESVVVPTPDTPVVKEHEVPQAQGGYPTVANIVANPSAPASPALQVPTLDELDDESVAQRNDFMDTLAAHGFTIAQPAAPVAAPELPAEEPAADVRFDQSTDIPVAPEIAPEIAAGDYGTLPGENIWETFEDRRKALKLPRDRFGTEMGHTKSLGWRLESGNVSNADAKKLGLDNVDAVYIKADQLLREYESGVRQK